MTSRARPHLMLPIGAAAILTGASALALLADHPRVALVILILALIITLAILAELISGDR